MLNFELYKNTYLGFTDILSPMQAKRAEQALEKLYRYHDEIMSAKIYVLLRLQEGAEPSIYEGVVSWSRKLHDYTKPKTEYGLKNEDNSYSPINKTEYDYACYLYNNDFTDDKKALAFIESENERKERVRQEQLEAEQKAQIEAERKEREKEQFDLWLSNEAYDYKDQEKLALLKEIFLAETGQFGGHSKRLLVLIDNFDDPQCKAKLKDWLSYYNTASLKTFFHITGINLGKTDKEIQARLDNISSKDFTGMIQFKARKKAEQKEQNLETFYIYTFDSVKNGYEFQEVLAEPFSKYGLDMFIQNKNGTYTLSESRTGLAMSRGNTKTEMLDELKKAIDRMGIDKVNEQIEQFISKNGLSPKYQEQAIA
jgi:hypothetical protein